MKFFIGQRVTGEDFNELLKEMDDIYLSLDEAGHQFYCTLQENENFQKKTKGEMMKHAFKIIDKSEGFLAIVRNEAKSEGLLMEIGYCLAKHKNIILLINKFVKDTYLREIASKIIEFADKKDMLNKLRKLNL